MLSATNIHKAFGRVEVLKGVDFTVAPGEIVGIVGASGSGKTVLARCLVGLEEADQGKLALDGSGNQIKFPADGDVDWPTIRRRVGYVSQARSLPPYRTILELVMEGPRYVKRLPKAEAEGIAIKLLNDFKLFEHVHKFPTEISGGQLARVCLARAMAMNPAYLLCDEVTANLDPPAAAKVGESLLKARDRGVGLAIISHQLGFIRTFGDRVDFLDNGRIAESGPPEITLTNPRNDELARFVKLDKIAV